MDAVALSAVIASNTVTLAAIGATAMTTRGQRRHERALKRGERLFAKRGDVYESMLELVFLAMERMDLIEPMLSYADQPQPPDPPPAEDFRLMQARLAAYASPDVAAAFDRFGKKSQGFGAAAFTVQVMRQRSGDPGESLREVHTYREEARAAVQELGALVRSDLGSL